MEYIRKHNKKYEGSSEIMEYLDEFISGAPCFWEENKREFLEAMQNYKNYNYGTQSTTYIRTVGLNRVILFDLDRDEEMELPFDALCNLTEKHFDLYGEKIDDFYLTLENEIFKLHIKYTDGKEEHLKFEACPESFAQETLKAEEERTKELEKGDKLEPKMQKKINAIDIALKKDPNNSRLLLERGFCLYEGYRESWRYRYIIGDAAIKAVSRAIEIDPSFIDAYFWLSSIYIRHDIFEERIIEFLEKAISLAPDRADLYLNMAKVYKKISQDWFAVKKYDNDKYVRCLQKAIELEPTWIMPRRELVLFLVKNKQFDFARQVLAEAYKVVQDDFPTPDTDMVEFYEIYVTGRLVGRDHLDDVTQYLEEKLLK